MSVETVDGLTDSQRERRRRVLRAALDLAEAGGYDAVQIRAVSTEAGVALGTIYRYFASKDHLLVAANVEWIGQLEQQVSARPPRGDTTADRVLDVLGHALRALERAPQLSAAVVHAQTTEDGAGAGGAEEISETTARIMASAFPTDIEPSTRDETIRTLGHVWFSCLVAWSAGARDMAWVRSELDAAVRLLCR